MGPLAPTLEAPVGNPLSDLFQSLLGRRSQPAPAEDAAEGPGRAPAAEPLSAEEALLEAKAWARREGLHQVLQWLGQNARYFHRWQGGPDAAYLSAHITHAAPAEPFKDALRSGERVALRTTKGPFEVAWWEQWEQRPGGRVRMLFYEVRFRNADCARVRYRHGVDPEDEVEKECFDDFETLQRGGWIDVARHFKDHYDQAQKGS